MIIIFINIIPDIHSKVLSESICGTLGYISVIINKFFMDLWNFNHEQGTSTIYYVIKNLSYCKTIASGLN